MSRKQTTTSTSHINALCPTNGHDWQETVSHTYRTCRRSGCRAAEHLISGKWVNTAHTGTSRRKEHVTTTFTPLLWTARQFDALTFPYPGYNQQWERHMEQQYHKAVTDEQRYRSMQRQPREAGAACK